MKKILSIIKNNYKLVVGIIIGSIITGTGVYAAVASSSISYDNKNSGLTSTNVQSAIDELNTKATTKIEAARKECPEGQTCSPALCKRATKLHTETCNQTSTTEYCGGHGYAKGATITYGSLGTKGTLAVGDAFDCDVDGNGTYSDTERFYYVTDLDSNTAVLIFYTNVDAGVASSEYGSVCLYASGGVTTYGPKTARGELPTTSQWKKVSLTNTTVDILDYNGTVKVSGFSYEGYAARFIRYSELKTACSLDSSLKIGTKCGFLYENTKYSNSSSSINGWWTETIYGSSRAYGVAASTLNLYGESFSGANPLYAARPAIEVPKAEMSY